VKVRCGGKGKQTHTMTLSNKTIFIFCLTN